MAKKKAESGDRMIHIRLSEEVHKQLRIRVAELDTTMQDFVADVVAKGLRKGGK